MAERTLRQVADRIERGNYVDALELQAVYTYMAGTVGYRRSLFLSETVEWMLFNMAEELALQRKHERTDRLEVIDAFGKRLAGWIRTSPLEVFTDKSSLVDKLDDLVELRWEATTLQGLTGGDGR